MAYSGFMPDRVVLISGASGNLGGAVTESFARAGARVFGVARSWRQAPAGVIPLEADLTDAAAARDVVEAVTSRAGRLDVLVHLMGGFAGGRPVRETADETWDQMMELNLRPAFRLFRAALRPMIASGGGRILAVGSRAGVEAPANLSAYNVSKAGLHALVRTVAAEVKDQRITANAVLPSTIDTPANRAAMPKADPSRWVRPEAIAAMLVWLASPEAAEVSGALIPVYGRG